MRGFVRTSHSSFIMMSLILLVACASEKPEVPDTGLETKREITQAVFVGDCRVP